MQNFINHCRLFDIILSEELFCHNSTLFSRYHSEMDKKKTFINNYVLLKRKKGGEVRNTV